MPTKNNCIFCKIAKKEIKASIVDESNNFIAFLDAHPKAKGHTLIIPKRHFGNLLDISDKLGEEMLSFTKKIASEMIQSRNGDGFNIVMNNLACAGQVVEHAHMHIIPRKEKDGLRMIA